MSPFCVSVGICDAVEVLQWNFSKVKFFQDLQPWQKN